jgi:hypothetical protein
VCGAYIRIFTVAGAEEVGVFPFIVVAATIIQLFSTVSAIQHPGKHTDDTAFCGPVAMLAKVLNEFKCLPVNDGRVGIRKDFPFLSRLVQALFQLK